MTTSSSNNKRAHKGGRLAPALCNVLGTALIVAVFALVLPVTVPRLMGYDAYEVLSGSMEPAIPVGSIIYVEQVDPSAVEVDDVVAYGHEGAVIAHRVLVNRTSLGELVTKGDANDVEDLDPIPYDAVMGRVATSVPVLGSVMAVTSSTMGKFYLVLTLACGVMLNVLADRMREARRQQLLADLAAARADAGTQGSAASATGGPTGGTAPSAKNGSSSAVQAAEDSAATTRRRSHTARRILAALLLAVFICSAGGVAYVLHGYRKVDELYATASAAYTQASEQSEGTHVTVPKTVDFAALQKVNPDVIGWLYCEGTPIDYPVLHGTDNDQYLHHDYTGAYDFAGSVFIESTNRPDFSDANTIVYGHHLLTGAMFSCLEDWQEQSFYEEHPVMWLLTPQQDYQVILVAGYHTSAYSDVYQVIEQPGEQMQAYLAQALAQSDFTTLDAVQDNPANRHVVLSTCAYVFDNARYVLHGMLVAVPKDA